MVVMISKKTLMMTMTFIPDVDDDCASEIGWVSDSINDYDDGWVCRLN